MTWMIGKRFLLALPFDERIKLVTCKDRKSEAEVLRELLVTAGFETKRYQTGSVGTLYEGFEIGKEVGGLCP
jgi:hypothetical protein